MASILRAIGPALLLAASAAAQHDGVAAATRPAEKGIDFAREVRPILAGKCFTCHGPDDAQRKAGLRLDRRADAFKAREDGAAFVAGDVAKSVAFARIVAEDPEERMPPPGAGDPLKPAEVAALKRWIESGAKWEEHWSFVAPVAPALPIVSDAAAKNPIDRYLHERLAREGIAPAPEASREEWLRRVTLDLTGLPPAPEEIDEFLRDAGGEAAYERVVDRLLASPRYGERQAADWMDVARYADSSGYQRDTPRTAWKWREWAIHAFNRNQPYDRFVVEQLAGDLLPNPTLDQRIATGFNRNHPVNTEAGEELDEYRSAYVIDRVHTTSTAFLGLSVACAQCHDHKYDPISQRDFYAFYGFFNHVKERDSSFSANPKPSIPAPGPDEAPRLADLDRRIKTLEKRLEQDDPVTDAAQAEWERETAARLGGPIVWTPLDPTELMARHGSRLKRLDDGSVLATGPTPARDTYELVFTPGKRKIQALRLEALPDPSQPHGASGRADDGRFILAGLEARLASVADSEDPPLVAFALAAADLNQKENEDEHYLTAIEPGSIAGSITIDDGEGGGGPKGGAGFRFGGGGWSVAGEERKEPREAVLVPLEPLVANDTSILRLTLNQGTPNKFRSLLGRFRVSYTEDPRVRTQLLAVAASHWRTLGPFPAADVDAAYAQAFEVEKDLATADWKKKYEQSVVEAPKTEKGGPTSKPSGAPNAAEAKAAKGAQETKDAAVSQPAPAAESKPVAAPAPAASGAPAASEGKSAEAKAATAAAPTVPSAASTTPTAPPTPNTPAAPGLPAAAAAGAPADPNAKPPEKKKPPKLEWRERRGFKDGSPARLESEGPATAWFLSRKLVTEAPRTATLALDGGVGAKVWLNGTLVAEFAPAPERPAGAAKPAEKKPEDEPDLPPFMRGAEAESTARRFRIGLRTGENHLAIKLVAKGATPRGDKGGPPGAAAPAGDAAAAAPADAPPPEVAMMFGGGGPFGRGGGGLTFTFEHTPEGDDLLDYETLLALRTRVAGADSRPVAPAVASASTPAAAPAIATAVAPTGAAPVPSTAAAPASQPTAGMAPSAPASRPSPAERRAKVVRRWYRTKIDPAGRALSEEVARLKEEKRKVEAKLPQALVMEELATSRPTHLFVRGDYRRKGELVATNTPATLPPMRADLPKNRLGLAQWIVAPENPLFARVTVNRVWQQAFGFGLVRTPDDFGIRGEPPTHPELLDWLATEFVRTGFDLKRLHRLIALSAAYRRTGTADPAAFERDPENRLYARGPRQRLSAEMVRDQALFAAGLLVEKIGGPSVKPYQPPGLWKSMLGGRDWTPDVDENAYRRGIYVYWKRGVPYPSFTAFDAAKRETCAVSRTKTTTPLQALVTLNDPVYVEAGRGLGLRMLKDGGKEDDARLRFGFRLVASRPPAEPELVALRALLVDLRAHYRADAKAAKELLGVGRLKVDEKLDPAEVAAWATTGSTLLNLEAAIRRG